MSKVDLELENAIRRYLSELDKDILSSDIAKTPKRFVKQLEESLSGYNQDPQKHLTLLNNRDYKDLIVVSDISFISMCEHHLMPFYGTVSVAYLPKSKILGLSKFARIVDIFSKRLQVQERLTHELTTFFAENLETDLVMTSIIAQHTCMTLRGALRPQSVTRTFSIVGDAGKNASYINYFQNTLGKS